ncbi:MAG: hypothetical protein J1F67_02935 [Muribaculaceae bacterium]|nr:hypothetical protein [Muribaculaceae bacterium]
MKKIFYLIAAVGITWGIVSCDNEPKNPGDYSVKSELSIGDVVSQVNGQVYALQVAKSIDSVFTNKVTAYDTIWDENGNFVSREGREVIIPSKFTTKYVEYEPIMVPAEADTFEIHVTSNAKWFLSTASYRGSSTFYNINSGGGGNGTLLFRSAINRNGTRKVAADLNVYTSDSTIYHKVTLLQEGLAN